MRMGFGLWMTTQAHDGLGTKYLGIDYITLRYDRGPAPLKDLCMTNSILMDRTASSSACQVDFHRDSVRESRL